MLKKFLLLTVGFLFIGQVVWADSYQIDPVHSQIHFAVAHLVVFKVKGEFTDYQGEVNVDPSGQTLQSAVATIKVASIDTREKKRDDHLRSADFFDAADYPDMTFATTSVEGSGDKITVHGNLTIRGNTREVVLTGRYLGAAKDPWGNQRAGFEAKGTINRHDFGLNWSKTLETGGLVVGDDVEIGLDIEAIRK
ncbi:MAG TPA: YceI family protein [Geothermobacteraceae bacterium]|nr:YceI family protein [Geothermobacteraceae bacterium]